MVDDEEFGDGGRFGGGFAECGSSEEVEYAPWEGGGGWSLTSQRGNKEGQKRDNVCFSTKPARLLPCSITLHRMLHTLL